MDLLSVRDLSVSLGDFHLRDVSFGVPEGAYCCLLGASGAGKSVLLETIIGGFRPKKGRVFLRGEDVTSWPPEKRKLGIVYQDYMLFPHLDVFGNIAFGLKGKYADKSEITSKVERIASQLGISDLLQRDVGTLSGGEQQRSALARALVTGPEILLLDEAFSALDVNTREKMRGLMAKVAREMGVTVLHVTHDREDVWALASHVAVIHDGEMLQHGTPEEVFSRPRPGYVAGIVGARNLVSGVVESRTGSELGTVNVAGVKFHTADPLVNGERVTLSIRPEDIMAAGGESSVSARNQIKVTITDVDRRGPLVWLTGAAGDVSLTAVLTASGYESLETGPGGECLFLFKASALRVVENESDDR